MAKGEFHKMHGLGNDFVIIDARACPMEMPPARARAIADRKIGIGCDQLILLLTSKVADVAMRILTRMAAKSKHVAMPRAASLLC
jgi:diaminopimelate epimerase